MAESLRNIYKRSGLARTIRDGVKAMSLEEIDNALRANNLNTRGITSDLEERLIRFEVREQVPDVIDRWDEAEDLAVRDVPERAHNLGHPSLTKEISLFKNKLMSRHRKRCKQSRQLRKCSLHRVCEGLTPHSLLWCTHLNAISHDRAHYLMLASS